MPKKLYHVHQYLTVRVKVWNVPAENHKEAIEKSLDAFDPHEMFPDRTAGAYEAPEGECVVQFGGFADEDTGFLVDEAGDADYQHSRFYSAQMEEENVREDHPENQGERDGGGRSGGDLDQNP